MAAVIAAAGVCGKLPLYFECGEQDHHSYAKNDVKSILLIQGIPNR